MGGNSEATHSLAFQIPQQFYNSASAASDGRAEHVVLSNNLLRTLTAKWFLCTRSPTACTTLQSFFSNA